MLGQYIQCRKSLYVYFLKHDVLHFLSERRICIMFIYIYNVIFNYIMLFFFDEHNANLYIINEITEHIRRFVCVVGLLRFRHLQFQHPVAI